MIQKKYLPLILSVAICFGYLIGVWNQINYNSNLSHYDKSNDNILSDIINYIDNEYVDTISKDKIIEETIQDLLQRLDPHSYYLSSKEFTKMNEPINGSFEGIGIQFNIYHDTLIVVNTISGGPSEKVGIKAGDRIIEVEKENITSGKLTNEKVLKLLKGKKGTKVNVTILRNKKNKLKFTITRDKIPLYSVDISMLLNSGIGYTKISRFSKTTYDEMMNAISNLKSKGMKKLIIDLRGNSGGLLNIAVKMIEEFMYKNTPIVYTKGRARDKEIYLANNNGTYKKLPLVILIDENSASASEIFAGAIQDNDRGTIIGRRSFGKGLVQEQKIWGNGAATRLTTARYYTPTGRCIQKDYTNGTKEYSHEFQNRFLSGEVYGKDTSIISDSTVYKTPKGKIVYGGGGIYPDIFIPIDTTNQTKMMFEIFSKGYIYDFSLSFADKYRKKAKGVKSIYQIIKEDALETEFLSFLNQNFKSKLNMKEWNQSKKYILKRLKALISRNLINEEQFYRIWLEDDKAIEKSVEILTNNTDL